MSTSIDTAFIRQYEAEVHVAYQRQGSKLRSSVRNKNNVKGASTTFQRVGTGVAASKTRHGKVPVMNVDRGTVDVTLSDYYAGDWVDALDELKTNIDERQVIINARAYALGRKTDELIIAALAGATVTVGDYSTGASKGLLLSAFEKLNAVDVPDDGQRFGVVGAHQWNELLNLKEFSESTFAGGAITIATAASAAGDVDTAASITAAKTVAAGLLINCTVSGTPGGSKQARVTLFIKP